MGNKLHVGESLERLLIRGRRRSEAKGIEAENLPCTGRT